MATKTSQKPHVEKTEIETIARMTINALSSALRRNNFTVETDGETVKIETLDIKAFINRRQIIVMSGLIDIKYNELKTVVSIYDYEKDDVDYIDMNTLNYDMDTLLELAKEKVREKLKKALREIE
jgi:hypothetical protein